MSITTQQADHTRWSLKPREIFLIFLFWTSLAALSSVNRLLDRPEQGFRVFSPAGPIAVSFIESTIWAAMTIVIFWLSNRFSREWRWIARVTLLLLIGVVTALGVYLVADFARA